MTFADRLEELRKAATETPWVESGTNQAGLIHEKTDGEIIAVLTARSRDREFISFLANHADAILELVRWSTVLVGHAPGDDLEAELGVVEALAKLNGE